LQECGLDLDLHVASDGQDALQYLEAVAGDDSAPCPALVLLDLNLPKVGGTEVLSRLRSGPCKRTPVIIVTSSGATADRAVAQRLGADAYFEKPADLRSYKELANLVRRFAKFCNDQHN
jgi:two-component system response regulator